MQPHQVDKGVMFLLAAITAKAFIIVLVTKLLTPGITGAMCLSTYSKHLYKEVNTGMYIC